MKQLGLVIALFLVSQICFSKQVLTMEVYKMTSDRVIIDQDKNYIVSIRHIDFIESVNERLSQAVQAELESTGFVINALTAHDKIITEYREAFSTVQNSDQWKALYFDYGIAATTLEDVVRYGIKKTPAILVNGMYLIYGVYSTEEAEKIYLLYGVAE
jgi:hypothetical protein